MPGFLSGECVPPVADLPFPIGVKKFDHIEADGDIGPLFLPGAFFSPFLLLQERVPFSGGLHDPALFFPVYGVGRGAVGFTGATFHLDEDQLGCPSDPADQIHFAAVDRAEVSVENFVSCLA
jgi:hypothetical protein